MDRMSHYLDNLATNGRSTFSKKEAMGVLGLSAAAFLSAAARQKKKERLVSLRQGFYLLLRPEDRPAGAPDPARWIDPLMVYLGLDYRVSLLRAAAYHGASHQAAMRFQVVVPRQQKDIRLGKQWIAFAYQQPDAFAEVNRPGWLDQIKTDAGFTKVAGVELTLLDTARYPKLGGGFDGVAQLAHDLGAKARPQVLGQAASQYESSVVRRLGYLLDHFGHTRQAKSLHKYVNGAKSDVLLYPAFKTLPGVDDDHADDRHQRKVCDRWRLVLNTEVEIDA